MVDIRCNECGKESAMISDSDDLAVCPDHFSWAEGRSMFNMRPIDSRDVDFARFKKKKCKFDTYLFGLTRLYILESDFSGHFGRSWNFGGKRKSDEIENHFAGW